MLVCHGFGCSLTVELIFICIREAGIDKEKKGQGQCNMMAQQKKSQSWWKISKIKICKEA